MGGVEVTKGDRDKLRAELAGKALIGMGNWLPSADFGDFYCDSENDVFAMKTRWAVTQADALMAELGIKGEE